MKSPATGSAPFEAPMAGERVEDVRSDNERLRQVNDALRRRIERHNMAGAPQEDGGRGEPAAEYFGWIRRYLEVALEASGAALALFTEEGRLLATNAKLLALFPGAAPRLNPGARFEDVTATISRCSSLHFPDEAARALWVDARIAARKLAVRPALTPLGDDRWVEVAERRMAHGAFALAFEDVTETVRARRRSRGAEPAGRDAAARAAIEALPYGLCAFDGVGRLTAWNEALRGLLALGVADLEDGLSFDEVCARIARAELLDLDDGEAARLGLWARAAPPRPALALEVERADGAILSVRCAESHDSGFVLTFLDVTAERRAAAEMRDMRDSLERRVFERTASLVEVNDKLVQEIAERRAIEAEMRRARDSAEAANLSKTRFIAAASHDLLQPLNAAKLFVSALTASDLPEPSAEVARRVANAFDSVESLLGALLDISKLDTGRGETALADFPVSAILRPVADEFRAVAERQGLKLLVAESALVVRSDPHYLRRIVQNLVGNALKYTERGGVVLGARRRADGVRIEVWDSGVGIPPSERRRIFEEFHRIDRANPRGERGMGLGLAIVERACRLLGHRIDIRSAEGRGSMFAVTVPRGDPAAVESRFVTAPHAGDDPLDSPLAGPAGSIIALLVEDDADVRSATASLLDRWGVDILVASDVNEALELTAALGLPPDVVLVDYHLAHGATGLEALRRLRAEVDQSMPAILITADRSAAVAREAREAGAQLLSKPVAPAKLRALLQWSQLDRASGASSPPP